MSFNLSRTLRVAAMPAHSDDVFWPPRFARLWPHVRFNRDAHAPHDAAGRPAQPAAPAAHGAAQPARRRPEEGAN